MEDEAQAAAYAAADFEEPNSMFCEQLAARFRLPQSARVVDLGCGPADIPIRLARHHHAWTFDVVDGSPAMLEHARLAITDNGLGARVRPCCSRLPARDLPASGFDVVISNSLLHHLADAGLFWQEVKRLGRPQALVMVMDLSRPNTEALAHDIVARYASHEPEILRRDYFNSLKAAFTPAEVEVQLAQAGLGGLSVCTISDRHLLAYGSINPV